MGDDCINVHARYLRIVHRIDASTALVSQPGEAPFESQDLPAPGQAFTFSDGRTLRLLGAGELSADAAGTAAILLRYAVLDRRWRSAVQSGGESPADRCKLPVFG